MNKKIIIQIPFNVQGFNKVNEVDEQWIKYRLGIFRKYCIGSLLNQTNQYFTVLLRVRESTIDLVKKVLRNGLPENILITGNNYEKTINKLIREYNYLYLIRMDSDDCYEENFVDMLQNYVPNKETEVLISQYCYDYDVINHRLASFWYHSPQSYVLIYRIEEYKKGKRYFLKRGHGGAILLKHELLKGYNYLNTIHKKNNECIFHDSNTVGRKGLVEIKDEKEKQGILEKFGLRGN